MSLSDDLKAYMSLNGKTSPRITGDPDVVIVGEYHGFYNSDDAKTRTTAMTGLVLELLKDSRFRYFANESFLNAGPVRSGLQDYWRRGVLPPALDGEGQNMDVQEIGRRIIVRRFQPVLDHLKARPRYVLSIGSRQNTARDRRLAQHFFEEVSDRGMPPRTPGVVLLGQIHAAGAAYYSGQTTTRMYLEKRGHKCVSILLLTDFIHRGSPDDNVRALGDPAATPIRLTSLITNSSISIPTRVFSAKGNPFRLIQFEGSDSGQSLADQFEHVVLQKS